MPVTYNYEFFQLRLFGLAAWSSILHNISLFKFYLEREVMPMIQNIFMNNAIELTLSVKADALLASVEKNLLYKF